MTSVSNICSSIPYIKVFGEPFSPIKHLRFSNQTGDRKLETKKLEKVVELVRTNANKANLLIINYQ